MAGLDGCGSGMRERRGDRAAWIREWDEGERKCRAGMKAEWDER